MHGETLKLRGKFSILFYLHKNKKNDITIQETNSELLLLLLLLLFASKFTY